MKSRIRPPCVVANPRHSYGYGCGLRLACLTNERIDFICNKFEGTNYRAWKTPVLMVACLFAPAYAALFLSCRLPPAACRLPLTLTLTLRLG